MHTTIGYHFVKSTHGTWLPGDERGHWSEAWDEQIGYIEPHMLHAGDPVRLRMARERMKHPEVRLTPQMMQVVEDTIARCAAESPWSIVAGSIERTHMHLLIPYTTKDIHKSMKWLAQQMTKEIHRCGARESGSSSSSMNLTGATRSRISSVTTFDGDQIRARTRF